MKKIYIPYIESLNNSPIDLSENILENLGKKSTIDVLNWVSQYPYRPITYFSLGRSKDSIFIKYSVIGSMLKAVYTQDQSPVHEDSCVEFFCMNDNADRYANFEFNCIGTCSASIRKGRTEDVQRFSIEQLNTIERYPSIGKRAFKEMEGMFEWELTVKIPYALLNIDPNNLPRKIKGNFYKCADDTDSVHFVTWAPVKTDKPDFHRPDFFGEIYFDDNFD